MPSMTLTCAICDKPMQKSRTSAPQGEAAHNACKSKAHGLSGYRQGCRCETCRDAQNKACSEYSKKRTAEDGVHLSAQWRRAKRGVDPLAVVNCTLCGKALRYVRTDQVARPMHKACKDAAPQWRREGRPNPKIEAFRQRASKAAKGTTGGKRVFTAGNCGWCGEYFVKAQAKWCSVKCKDSARFAAKSQVAFKVSPKVRRSIYERDGWICQLCLLPVDETLHYLDNWAASLDHIIPQSHQLIPDHSPNALRLAHRWCNSARGDGANMVESELVTRAHAGLLLAA